MKLRQPLPRSNLVNILPESLDLVFPAGMMLDKKKILEELKFQIALSAQAARKAGQDAQALLEPYLPQLEINQKQDPYEISEVIMSRPEIEFQLSQKLPKLPYRAEGKPGQYQTRKLLDRLLLLLG